MTAAGGLRLPAKGRMSLPEAKIKEVVS